MSFPNFPSTGKGGKVLINAGDGTSLSLASMTKQATYTYKGTSYTNRVYLLGTGKTLINTRPAIAPQAFVDGLSSEVTLAGTAVNDVVSVSAHTLLVDGSEVTGAANTGVAFTRPAATEGAWVAVHSNKVTGVTTTTKGTDTASGTGIAALIDTYGAAAGERPLIATDEVLLGFLKVTNGAAALLSTEIFYDDQERSDTVAYTILPNVGGVLLNTALVAMHTLSVARGVKFTGYYVDGVMTEIGTAKEWSLTPSTTTASETTLGGSFSQTEISGWAFTFNQLASDQLVKNAMLLRQGFMAVRLMYPNLGYWQSVGSGAGSFKCAPGAYNNVDVSGSLGDDPIFV